MKKERGIGCASMTKSQGYDIIVIGSGVGALAFAGLMSRMRGSKVLLLERHHAVGGFSQSYFRPGGRSWDVGLHYVGQMGVDSPLRKIMDYITEDQVEWVSLPDPFEKFVYPDLSFEVPAKEKVYRAELLHKFPSEARAIRQYFTDVKLVAGWLACHQSLKSTPSFVKEHLESFEQKTEDFALQTTQQYLNSRFKNQKLKAVLASQWGTYGLPPSQSAFATHAQVVYHYLEGAYYPVGGAGQIAEGILPVIQRAGGACLLHHEVREIIIRKGEAVGVRVRAHEGRSYVEKEFFAPVIVSAAGAYNTYIRLLPEKVDIEFRDELESLHQGFSVVQLYLGLTQSPSVLKVRGENHWFFDSYDHEDIYARHNQLIEGKPCLCYLSFPSLKNPAARTPTAEIMAPLDYRSVIDWKKNSTEEDFSKLKETISKSLIKFVDKRLPGFADLIEYHELATPLTMEHYTGHRNGNIFGIPGTPQRYRAKWLQAESPIQNLYITGVDAASHGIAGALMGGVSTASCLLKPMGFSKILRTAQR